MSTVLSVRLNPEIKEKLEKIAKSTRRSKSFLAAEAIKSYVEVEAAQLVAIEEGIRQADAGEFIEHEEVMKWLDSWGTNNPLPRPRYK
ncbi:MAG: CopG family ribbon-helix-helix protein [Acidobacteriaceae bacterium]